MPEIPYFYAPSQNEVQEELNARQNVESAIVKYEEPEWRISVIFRHRGSACYFDIKNSSLIEAERIAFAFLDAVL